MIWWSPGLVLRRDRLKVSATLDAVLFDRLGGGAAKQWSAMAHLLGLLVRRQWPPPLRWWPPASEVIARLLATPGGLASHVDGAMPLPEPDGGDVVEIGGGRWGEELLLEGAGAIVRIMEMRRSGMYLDIAWSDTDGRWPARHGDRAELVFEDVAPSHRHALNGAAALALTLMRDELSAWPPGYRIVCTDLVTTLLAVGRGEFDASV